MTRKQLWETFTNLAYPVAGLWTGEPVFMVMMLGLGIASAYYHAGGKLGNHWDVGAIYAVLLFLIVAVWHLSPLIAIPVGVIPAAFWLRVKQINIPMEPKIGALSGLLIVFGFLSGVLYAAPTILMAFGLCTGVLVVALAVRRWVDHGTWHILSAYGLALCWYGVELVRTAALAAPLP